MTAIGLAGDVEALARALQDREQQRRNLMGELATLAGATRLSNTEVNHISRNLRARVTRWRQLLSRQTDGARQAVSELLDGRIAWTPQPEKGRYNYKGGAKFDGLFEGFVLTQGDTSPTGRALNYEPFFRGQWIDDRYVA